MRRKPVVPRTEDGRRRTEAGSHNPLAEHLVDQLREVPGVEARRMFGGLGFYREGVFFGLVYKGRVYFKTDETSRTRYLDAGMKPFRPRPGQKLGRYYEVPADVIENRAELADWAREAIRVADEGK